MNLVQGKVDSQVGPLFIVASEKKLHGLFWKLQSIPLLPDDSMQEHFVINQTRLQLDEYFLGLRKIFDLPLSTSGTKFQMQVWDQLSKIPYGQTRSYKDIATALHDKNACRAVGSANGKNPISIIVPCHRVISSDGTLGGFAGGLVVKEKLLALEKEHSIVA